MSDFDRLAAELTTHFGAGWDSPIADGEFDALALRVFAYQFEANPAYRRFCEARGRTPGRVERWQEIPPVPSAAFKQLDLVSGDPARVERTFRTSGTTRGGELRGRHPVLSLDLYRAASLPGIERHLLPDLDRIRVLSLIPSVEGQPESSLATMTGFLIEAYGAGGSGSFADPETGVDVESVLEAFERAIEEEAPVLIPGTAFAFVHLLDRMAAAGRRLRLPTGSRVMETGGFKGRSREVPREELYRMIEAGLGLGPDRIVNEYGMTELLSQFWEPTLLDPDAPRLHRAPPWLRTRVVDPVDLSPKEPGEPGILLHLDLANLGSVSAVLTEDRGLLEEDGLRLLGRSPGAEPRGCSMTMEDFVRANR